MNVIYILWLRQFKRYVRSKSRLLGSLAQPLLFLVAFGFGFGPIYQKAGAGSYLQFLSPGIIAMSVLFTAMFSGIEIIWDRQFGVLKETLVAPVPRLQIMAGKTLGGATIAVVQGCVVLLISFLAGFRVSGFYCLPLLFLFMLLISLLFTALGTAIACLMDDMHGFQLIMNFLVMPLFFLSGALFPLENLPKALTMITRIDPLSYGVDGMRGALGFGYHFGLTQDLFFLSLGTILLLALGSYLFSKIEL